MEIKFRELSEKGLIPDNITFAGNGEPTLHPAFPEIIDDTIALRNQYFPGSKITVLSNATTLKNEMIDQALMKADNNVLKLDAGTEEYLQLINNPPGKVSLDNIVSNLRRFNGNLIIQSLFLKGNVNGVYFDSTGESNVAEWLKLIREISPKLVMIYPIDRATPLQGLEKVPQEELEKIASRVNELGIATDVYS